LFIFSHRYDIVTLFPARTAENGTLTPTLSRFTGEGDGSPEFRNPAADGLNYLNGANDLNFQV